MIFNIKVNLKMINNHSKIQIEDKIKKLIIIINRRMIKRINIEK